MHGRTELSSDTSAVEAVEAGPAGDVGNVLPLTGRGTPRLRASNTATESQVRESALLPLHSSGPYIDWLTVAQIHTVAPMVGSTLLIFADVDSGEIQSQSIKGLQIEGSYDSRLLVRSDGRRVEVSGNPSRFGRADNVFGLTSIEACLQLYNGVLRALGLPEFTLDDQTYPAQLQGSGHPKPRRAGAVDQPMVIDWSQVPDGEATAASAMCEFRQRVGSDRYHGGVTQLAEVGCRIKRIDLVDCYQAGSLDDARRSIRALGSVTHVGKAGFVYPDGLTVAWGTGSRYVYSKYYVKGPEMRKHLPQADEYAKLLTDWACDVGLVRHEVSFKSMFLRRNGLDQPSKWSSIVAAEVMSVYKCHEKSGAAVCSYDRISDELAELGVSVARARRAQEAAYAYLSGHQFVIGTNISKSAFYRLKGDLRKVGLDIGAPLNVSALRFSVRTIEWQPAQPPTFYRRAV